LTGRKKVITEDGLRRKREASASRVWTEESKEKLRKAHLGMYHSEESKQKMRVSQRKPKQNTKGYSLRWTEEERAKRSTQYSGEGNPNFGKHLSEETKKSMSEKAKARGGRPQTEEERKKRSESIRAWHAARRALLPKTDTN